MPSLRPLSRPPAAGGRVPVPARPIPRYHRPSLLVALTVVLVAFPKNGPATGVQVASVTPADIGAVLLVCVVGLGILRGGDLTVLRTRIMLAPVLMVAAAVVSAIWSTAPFLSFVGVSRYAELFCVVPVAVVLSIRDRLDAALVLGAVVALGAFEGAVGVHQSATGTGAGFAGQTIRAVGTYGVTDVLAMATVVACSQVVLLAVALQARRRSLRVGGALGAAALTAPLLLSLSRGALLALIVAAAVMLVAGGLARALATVVVLAAVATLVLSVLSGVGQSAIASRFLSIGGESSQPDRSVQDRYDLWATAVSIWHVDPLTGVGIKQFPAYRDSHAPLSLSSGSELLSTDSYTRGELLSPHNEYLLFLSEQGLLGLLGYAVMLAVIAARHIRLLATGIPRNTEGVLVMATFGLFVWFGVHLTYGDLSGSGAVLYAVLLGLQLRSSLLERSPLP